LQPNRKARPSRMGHQAILVVSRLPGCTSQREEE
jgi:hypothetical protein